MFYSAANVSELQNFRSFYAHTSIKISLSISQEHLLMADSDKNICDSQLGLLVVPRNLLKFGFNIVISISQRLHCKYCLNNYFLRELLLYGNQSIGFCSDKIITYNVNCSAGFLIMLSLLILSFLFLKIISEGVCVCVYFKESLPVSRLPNSYLKECLIF